MKEDSERGGRRKTISKKGISVDGNKYEAQITANKEKGRRKNGNKGRETMKTKVEPRQKEGNGYPAKLLIKNENENEVRI
jgi:hypothetical protein